MIITKTPLRIPFFSGGSDIKEFYQRETGAALSCTIDKYVYVSVHKHTEDNIRFLYDPTEVLTDLSLMKHQITKEVLRYFSITKGLTISSISDVNHRGTGLGSSSAYTVGLIKALMWLQETPVGENIKKNLAEIACEIEIDRCGFPIGKQDQLAATYGGLNLFQFYKNENVDIATYNGLLDEKLEENLFLVNTKIVRDSTNILKNYKSISMDDEKFTYAKYNKNMAYKGLEFIKKQDYDAFGNLFNESWEHKKAMGKSYSNNKIDMYYDACMRAGAYGGKVLGAGGGGFMLFYVPKECHDSFRLEMNSLGLEQTPFKFVKEGSEVILCE